ncbi:hypothetical protein A2U01_0043397, partial [Trifolium medium]|nr:hypothetical protein [Trifolium medium]
MQFFKEETITDLYCEHGGTGDGGVGGIIGGEAPA